MRIDIIVCCPLAALQRVTFVVDCEASMDVAVFAAWIMIYSEEGGEGASAEYRIEDAGLGRGGQSKPGHIRPGQARPGTGGLDA